MEVASEAIAETTFIWPCRAHTRREEPTQILLLDILFVCMPIDFIDNTKHHKFGPRPCSMYVARIPYRRLSAHADRQTERERKSSHKLRKKFLRTRWELKFLTFMTHFLFSSMHFLISCILCAMDVGDGGGGGGRMQELVPLLFIACSFRFFPRSSFFILTFRPPYAFATVQTERLCSRNVNRTRKNASFGSSRKGRCSAFGCTWEFLVMNRIEKVIIKDNTQKRLTISWATFAFALALLSLISVERLTLFGQRVQNATMT